MFIELTAPWKQAQWDGKPRRRELKAVALGSWFWPLVFLLHSHSASPGQEPSVSLLLAVPPRIENEDLEEAVKVPEGQTAHLMCNATGKGHTHGRLGEA